MHVGETMNRDPSEEIGPGVQLLHTFHLRSQKSAVPVTHDIASSKPAPKQKIPLTPDARWRERVPPLGGRDLVGSRFGAWRQCCNRR